MTEIGTVVDGKYRILEEIGRGGMSVVYLAMDTHLNRTWAVKEVRKQGNGKNDEIVVNSLLAEANMVKRLDHPALPRIVDIIDNGQTIYIIMDYIEGESLDKVLAEYGVQSEENVISWAKQICDVLSYLHSQKPPIIYRDMKPANLMLKPNGNISIIDFGIAREYKEQSLADTTVLGTKGYAPPEQYNGQTDPRSDIFALGMTMHHLLTGIDPRRGEPYAPVRQFVPELSEGIELIIEKCVEPAAENRYQNCADLLYDLEHPELITQGYKKTQKRKLAAFVVPAALSVLLAVTGVITRFLSVSINNSSYDSLIGTVNSIDNYKEAIGIYPERTGAYMKVLETYENEGSFGRNENDEYMALYNAHKDSFDPSSADTAELNYKTGMMYFNYYTGDGAEDNFSVRVQKAYPFFAENYESLSDVSGFEEKSLSDCYYQICSFYKSYILSSAKVEEASREDYNRLFQTIQQAMNDVRSAGAYDQLTLYNSVFLLLYDQRASMASVNVDEDTVLQLLKQVYEGAEGVTTNKDQSKQLRQEILNNYKSYREAIERTYQNVKERS